jgi:electron transport complex protein RnfG
VKNSSVKKDFIMPIVVLSVICLIVSGALAVTNRFTAPTIADAARLRADSAMHELIPDASAFTELDATGLPTNVIEAYAAKESDDAKHVDGYIFTVSATGYGGSGSVKIMVAVNTDGRVKATKTLANGETKGMGSRVSEPDYESQFVGMDDTLTGYNAVSGATISSKAYSGAVADALAAYKILNQGAAQ